MDNQGQLQVTYPLFVSLPSGTLIPLSDSISEIPDLTNWLEESLDLLLPGEYTVLFLAESEFELPLVTVTLYSNKKWGISRIEYMDDSPFSKLTLSSEDIYLYISHISSKVPSATKSIYLGATEDDHLPFGYIGKQGLALYFIGSENETLATLDLYWAASKFNGDNVPWRLSYFDEDYPNFMDENIIVPSINEAIAIAGGIKREVNVPLQLVYDMP